MTATQGKLAGKVAVATGGASGSGAAICREFVLQGARVAIADRNHEAAVRLVVADLLSEIGYQVTQAENAPEALKLLERLPDLHMLITDVGLPGMDGRQLAERVVASRPRAKGLFMTGYAERAISSAELLTSGGQVIVKPFVVETFAETVRKALDSRTAP